MHRQSSIIAGSCRNTAPARDADGDGIPDEEDFITQPSSAESSDPRTGILDREHDGHTNLEAYLNSIAPK